MTPFETRRMGRTDLIAEYTSARSFKHGAGLDYWLIRAIGGMDTDRIAATVLEDREARNGKQRSTAAGNN